MPIVAAVAVDCQPPRVLAARLERQRLDVDCNHEVERGARLRTRRATDLELLLDLDRPWVIFTEQDGLSVRIDELESPPVVRIRLIPRHIDLQGDRHRYRLWAGHRPAAAEDVELSLDRLRGVGEKKRRSQLTTQVSPDLSSASRSPSPRSASECSSCSDMSSSYTGASTSRKIPIGVAPLVSCVKRESANASDGCSR